MRRASRWVAVLAVLTIGLASVQVALAGRSRRDAQIAGQVLVCNGPGRCFQRQFQVSAINSAGHTVARTTTTDASNDYKLSVVPGTYKLVATSSGLNCQASATAVAHHTTHQNITCPVP